jgi:hypothetical protein
MLSSMHRRFICDDCRLKWFVTDGAPPAPKPERCPACGGELQAIVAPVAAPSAND